MKVKHARIDHVHHLRVHFFLHAPLLPFELARPVLQLSNINIAKVILRSRLTKQTVRVRINETRSVLDMWIMVSALTHWLSSLIQSYCFSRFVAAVTWPAFSFARDCTSCSSFLIATSASAAACFFALMTSSNSRSSVSNRVSVARSSCSRRSASACFACQHHFDQFGNCGVSLMGWMDVL